MDSSTRDDRIEMAMTALDSQKRLNYAAAAREYGVHRTTLMRRYCGKSVSRQASTSEQRQLLNDVQEDELLRYIDSLTDRFIPPTTQIIKNLAEEILKRPVGKNWTSQFVKRHSERIQSVYLRSLDHARVSAESPSIFEHFYALLTRAIETYHITAENIYNWDEKGFLIGYSSATKRIMTKQAYEQGRIRYSQQDGNREFISLLACICADGTALPPSLIYKGASNDLQSTWLEDLQEQNKAYFASSPNGWTCNELGLAWLRRFDQDTRQKAGNRRRLLLVDGHSSHVNMAFLSLADSLRILVLILPPHSTHRLQPLDVALFGPLTTAYTKELNDFTHRGLGWISMTKRLFWTLFHAAWKQSFTTVNILQGFAKTGIWPLNPSATLKHVRKSNQSATPSKLPVLSMKTPLTIRGIRRIAKASPSERKQNLLQRAVFRLATQNEIQRHENQGLRQALTQEKKRRQRGKRLNLLGEKESHTAQFFSPQRILAAKAYQAEKEATDKEKQLQKTQKKEEADLKRQQKKAEEQERAARRAADAVQRELRKQYAAEEKQARTAQRKAEQARKRKEREQARLEKPAICSLNQLSKKRAVGDGEKARPTKRSKIASAEAHHTSTTMSSGVQLPNRVITVPNQSGPLLNGVISAVDSEAAETDVRRAEICTRRGRAVKTPRRLLL